MEIKTGRALSESRSCCEPGRTQIVKWTTEGAIKGISRVYRDVKAYVSCQEYVSILISVRKFPQSKVAPRVLIYQPVLDYKVMDGFFVLSTTISGRAYRHTATHYEYSAVWIGKELVRQRAAVHKEGNYVQTKPK